MCKRHYRVEVVHGRLVESQNFRMVKDAHAMMELIIKRWQKEEYNEGVRSVKLIFEIGEMK